jgi:hypothetical protein
LPLHELSRVYGLGGTQNDGLDKEPFFSEPPSRHERGTFRRASDIKIAVFANKPKINQSLLK